MCAQESNKMKPLICISQHTLIKKIREKMAIIIWLIDYFNKRQNMGPIS